MPKERRDRSVSFDSCRASPYTCSSSHATRSSAKIPSGSEENLREWEEARCAVCIEHPHNAVLLKCTSYEKGCRPYMCDTSHRHSNCLDQFRKSFGETLPEIPQPEESRDAAMVASSGSVVTDIPEERSESEVESLSTEIISCENKVHPKLMCPLCRGEIKGCIIVKDARRFMNAKARSCACETCEFTGTYSDLRKHARVQHPHVRPSEADPERERNWRRLERQRDFGDLLSTLQSSFGGERGDNSILTGDENSILTVFFLVRAFPRNSSWSGTRAQLTFRRRSNRLWGETHEGETGSSSRDEENESSDGGTGPWRRSERLRERARRRTTPDQS